MSSHDQRLERWQRKLNDLEEGTPEYKKLLQAKPTKRRAATNRAGKKAKAKKWDGFVLIKNARRKRGSDGSTPSQCASPP